jgi:UDP-N-acetylglucosamine--N-acetylmuramyl-(pentapeptide) pyrophosphoryl-undecaprenol N-acetylglucosamine transferase
MLRRGTPPGRVVWLGAGRGVEERVLEGARGFLGEIPLALVSLGLEVAAGGAPTRPQILLRSLPALRRAYRALLENHVDVLLGLGGASALPAVLAAKWARIPTCLLEINAKPGTATRWLAPFARRVFHAWPSSVPRRAPAHHVVLGPPLAPQFLGGPPGPEETRAARLAWGMDPARPVLLILGGSQGALALNRFARAMVPTFVSENVQVLHQLGPGRRAEGAADGPGYFPVEYIEDMPLALATATVVLCRGGASTLAEVAARARPAWVVPYPHHRDRHQEANARALGPGVRIVEESRLNAGASASLLRLCQPDGAGDREAMAEVLGRSVALDAGERLAAELLGCV